MSILRMKMSTIKMTYQRSEVESEERIILARSSFSLEKQQSTKRTSEGAATSLNERMKSKGTMKELYTIQLQYIQGKRKVSSILVAYSVIVRHTTVKIV